MNLLFLSFYFQPDLSAGSFRATALIEELKKHPNIRITVITTLPNRYASFNAEAPKLEQSDNVNIHRIALPAHKSGMIDQAKAFIHFYRGAMAIVKHKSYDGVYGTSSRLFTAFLTARIAKKKDTPYYLDIRDIFVDTLSDLIAPKVMLFARPILHGIERYSFNKAETINLVSEGFKDYFNERFPNNRYQYFTNGIDEEFIDASKDSLKNVTCVDQEQNDPIKIVYAGNIGEGQGLHNIIPLLARELGQSYHIKLIGDGGRKALLEEKCQGIPNVSLHPPVQRKQLIQEYQAADILFLHLNECQAFEKVLPSKIFEYASMGKPILAGVAGYAARFIEKEVSNAVIFSPTNAREALSAVRSLELHNSQRKMFIDKFKRQNISKGLAKSVLPIMKPK